MKKLLTLLTAIAFTAIAASATEPLLLDPINPAVLNDIPAAVKANIEGLDISVPGQSSLQATYIKDPNMIPQNAAAEGKPVPKKRMPRVRIETKQGRQTNTQWNPGGKGTKSFF